MAVKFRFYHQSNWCYGWQNQCRAWRMCREMESAVKRNSRVKTSQTKNSFQHYVDDAKTWSCYWFTPWKCHLGRTRNRRIRTWRQWQTRRLVLWGWRRQWAFHPWQKAIKGILACIPEFEKAYSKPNWRSAEGVEFMTALQFISEQMSLLGVAYEFDTWTSDIVHPYFVGEFRGWTTEDGAETSYMILTGANIWCLKI